MKHRNIINYVKPQRLSWSGHINRLPETSILRKIYQWKPFTSRPVERLNSSWEDDVRNDLKKMKLKNGQTKSKIALNGRTLLRKSRLYQGYSAEEEEFTKLHVMNFMNSLQSSIIHDHRNPNTFLGIL
jgi:hypothetical protein